MATKKMGAPGKAAPLDPKVAGKLLDKLSTDNEFRRLFKKDPKAALIQAGHKVPKGDAAAAASFEQLAACAQVVNIATKTDIVKARQEIMANLTAGLSHQPVQLNAPSAERRTRK